MGGDCILFMPGGPGGPPPIGPIPGGGPPGPIGPPIIPPIGPPGGNWLVGGIDGPSWPTPGATGCMLPSMPWSIPGGAYGFPGGGAGPGASAPEVGGWMPGGPLPSNESLVRSSAAPSSPDDPQKPGSELVVGKAPANESGRGRADPFAPGRSIPGNPGLPHAFFGAAAGAGLLLVGWLPLRTSSSDIGPPGGRPEPTWRIAGSFVREEDGVGISGKSPPKPSRGRPGGAPSPEFGVGLGPPLPRFGRPSEVPRLRPDVAASPKVSASRSISFRPRPCRGRRRHRDPCRDRLCRARPCRRPPPTPLARAAAQAAEAAAAAQTSPPSRSFCPTRWPTGPQTP